MKSFYYLLTLLFIAFLVPNKVDAQSKINSQQLLEDLRVLSADDMEGRKVGTDGNRKAREFMISRYIEAGAKPVGENYSHPFVFKTRAGIEVTGVNIVGKIEGKTEAQIVISAHYDHLGIRDGEIYNGADDDASGSVALLQFIAYFAQHQPEHTLIFVAFDAEEGGLRGSRDFVTSYADVDKVKMNINMDMISISDKNELYAVGTYHYPELKPILEPIETGTVHLLFGHDSPDSELDDWTFSSDHGPFHSQKIPFIYFGVEDHPHYHKATDMFENITKDFYKASVEVVLNAVLAFDTN